MFYEYRNSFDARILKDQKQLDRKSVYLVQCTCNFHPFFKYRIIMRFSSFILSPTPPPFFPFSSVFAFFFLLFLFSSFTSSYFDFFPIFLFRNFLNFWTFLRFSFLFFPIYPTHGRTGIQVYFLKYKFRVYCSLK